MLIPTSASRASPLTRSPLWFMTAVGFVLAVSVGGLAAVFLLLSHATALEREKTVVETTLRSVVRPMQADLELMLRIEDEVMARAGLALEREGTLRGTRYINPDILVHTPSLIGLHVTDAQGRVLDGFPASGEVGRDARLLLQAQRLLTRLERDGIDRLVESEPWGLSTSLLLVRGMRDRSGTLVGLTMLRLASGDLAEQVARATVPWLGQVGLADHGRRQIRWMPTAVARPPGGQMVPETLDACGLGLRDAGEGWLCLSTPLLDDILNLVLAVPESALLVGWREDAVMVAMLGGGGSVLTLGLFILIGMAVSRLFSSEQGFREALVICPDAIVITRRRDDVVVMVNPGFTAATGWAASEVIGKTIRTLGLWGSVPERALLLAQVQRQGAVSNYAADFQNRAGSRLYGLISAAVIPLDGEDHIIFFVKDITALRATQGQLQATIDRLVSTSSELERFAHAASHDLQEPLRSLVSFSQLLERDLGTDLSPTAREDLRFITTSALRMRELVQGLLDYAQMTATPDAFESCALGPLVSEALEILRPTMEDGAVSVSMAPLPDVMGNPRQLAHLFRHVLENAIKFRKSGEVCRVRVFWQPVRYASQPLAQISISDTGIGMAPAEVEQAFQLFKRFHSWAEYPGNGAGLALCRHIVTQHGGSIWLESAPGEGTTVHFTLRLPDLALDVPV